MKNKSDKGWGKLPRRIARALAGAKLNDYEHRLVWCIVYYTFAWTKAEDWITWEQMSVMTGIDQWHLSRPINSLLKKGVIFMKANRYGVQLDFSKWETPPIQVVAKITPPIQEKTPPIQEKTPPIEVDSLDLLLRTKPKRGFTKPGEEKRQRKTPEGLKNLMKDIGNMPGKIKTRNRLR